MQWRWHSDWFLQYRRASGKLRVRIREKGGAGFQFLHPAQLEAAQDAQPLDMECVVPSLDFETPLKQEKSFSTCSLSHSGQDTPLSDDPKTSFSNSDSHFKHLNSNIGITTSAVNPFDFQ